MRKRRKRRGKRPKIRFGRVRTRSADSALVHAKTSTAAAVLFVAAPVSVASKMSGCSGNAMGGCACGESARMMTVNSTNCCHHRHHCGRGSPSSRSRFLCLVKVSGRCLPPKPTAAAPLNQCGFCPLVAFCPTRECFVSSPNCSFSGLPSGNPSAGGRISFLFAPSMDGGNRFEDDPCCCSVSGDCGGRNDGEAHHLAATAGGGCRCRTSPSPRPPCTPLAMTTRTSGGGLPPRSTQHPLYVVS